MSELDDLAPIAEPGHRIDTDAKDMDNVMRPFGQVRDAQRGRPKGTGLGLPLSSPSASVSTSSGAWRRCVRAKGFGDEVAGAALSAPRPARHGCIAGQHDDRAADPLPLAAFIALLPG